MKRMLLSLAGVVLALSLGSAVRADDNATPSSTTPATTESAKPAKAMHHAHHKMAAAKMPALDLNSASKEDLTKLPGVDDATADKIIAARPFTMRSDLVKKDLVTKAQYAKIKGKVTVKKS